MYYFRIFVSSILLTWIIIVIFISKSRCQWCLEKVILWHHHWYSPWSFVLVNILKKGRRKKNSMEVHLVNVIFIEITTQRSFYCIILFVIFVTFSAFMKCWSNLWGLLTPHNNQNPFSYRKIFPWRNNPVKKEALLKRRVKNIILVFWIRLPKSQRNTSFKASLLLQWSKGLGP